MKRGKALLLGALLLGAFACSDDSEDSLPITRANLEGRWELTKEYDAADDYWDEEYGERYGYYYQWEFRKDGTALQREKYPENPDWYEATYTYTLEGDVLTFQDRIDIFEVAHIRQLTAGSLTLAYTYTDDFGGTYTDLAVYRRLE